MTDEPATRRSGGRDRVVAGAIAQVVAVPIACGLVAWVWKFPVMMVGHIGGDMRAAFGAAFTAVAWMTLLSFGIGLAIAAALGAGLGRLLSRYPWWWTPITASALAITLAVAAEEISHRAIAGPGWIHAHVGGFDDHQTTLGGQGRFVDQPDVGVEVTIRGDAGESSTTTGSQGWAMLRVPRGDYEVETPCGTKQVKVAMDEHVAVMFFCRER